METLSDIQYWHWLIVGIALIILEVFAPSTILLWPGIAAIITGAIGFVTPSVGFYTLLGVWAVLSLLMIVVWRFYKKNNPSLEAPSTINRRGEQIVGRHFTLTKDITNGVGELHVDDTRWKIISSADIHAGKKVKVVAVEGTSLRVEEFTS